MSSTRIPENLEIEISEALSNLNSPKKLSESNLLSFALMASYKQKNPSALPYQILKAVLTDILGLLENENADYADILHGRFWEGLSPANMIANGRPKQWSEKTFYNYQKRARQEFNALLWQKEQECIQDISEGNPDTSPLPVLQRMEKEPQSSGSANGQNAPKLASTRFTTKILLPVGILILMVVVIVMIVQFAGRAPLLQTSALSPVATTPTVGATLNAVETVPVKITVCGDGQADPIAVDGSVPRFLRNQGVSSFTVENTPGVLNNKVRSLFIDQSGLWIGYFATETNSDNGLGHYDRTSRSLTNCNQVPYLAGQNINAVVTDHNGMLWVGTEKNGLAAFDGKIWQHYSRANGLPSDEIYGLTVDEKNNLWVGTWEGVAKFDGRTWTVPYTVQNDTLFNNHVHTILFDSQENIWVGHIEKGISKYSQADGSWVHLTATPGGLSGNHVRGMALQAESATNPESIWVATQDGGVDQYKNGVWTSYGIEDGLPSNEVRSVAIDKYNRIWAATAKGVVYRDNQQWILYHQLDTFSLAFGINCPEKTCSIDDDHVWTGTVQSGLTQSRLPLLESETPLDVNSVCFELSNEERICPSIIQDSATGDLTITYPEPFASGEQFQVYITITPRANYSLEEERGDMLSNIDADDSNLFGRWEHIKVMGTVEQGEPFEFVDYDNLFEAPQLPENVQEQTFTSTWRVWRHNRYVGPSIHITFKVKKP